MLRNKNLIVMVASLLFVSCGAEGGDEGDDGLESGIRQSISVLADPNSSEDQIRGALVAIYFCTPSAAAKHLGRHFASDDALIRGLAYQAAINLGEIERVRDRLVEDATSIVPNQSGNKQLLLALAKIEEPAVFLPRIDALDLRPSVEFVATTGNRFFWSDESIREALMPDMLRASNDGELTLIAARYMFENDRIDLLRKHRLVGPQPDPFEMFATYPGWDRMTWEQRAAIIGEGQFKELEKKATNPVPWLEPLIRQSVECWGYSVRQKGTELYVDGPG